MMALVKEIPFRKIYHKFCLIRADSNLKQVLSNTSFSLNEGATGVLTYGYIDHTAGFTFEVLATVSISDDCHVTIIHCDKVSSLKLRRGGVSNCEIFVLPDDNFVQFKDNIENIKSYYENSGKYLPPRNIEILDPLRYENNPDDVIVVFDNGKDQPEGCWVRCEEIFGGMLIGILLNEPTADFGVHRGDAVPFSIKRRKDSSIYCEAIL